MFIDSPALSQPDSVLTEDEGGHPAGRFPRRLAREATRGAPLLRRQPAAVEAHRRALAFSATFVVYVDRLKALVLVVAGQTVSPIVD